VERDHGTHAALGVGRVAVEDGKQFVLLLGDRLDEELDEHRFLRREVVVDAPVAHATGLGELSDAEPVEPALGDEVGGRGEDLLPGRRAVRAARMRSMRLRFERWMAIRGRLTTRP
jgi:hypothetical protein